MRCVFANATFTGGRATARSHENRSRGGVLSCRVRWHMRGGMRVPYHARAPQQREQRSRFGHCAPPESLGGTMRFHRRENYAHAAPRSLGSISRASTPLRALSTRKAAELREVDIKNETSVCELP